MSQTGLPATAASESPTSLRDLGRLRVLEALASYGRLSRPELIRRTGLARATVSSVTADLFEAGLAVDDGAVVENGGRPARLLSLAPSAAFAVGVDIGHDHVRCMACDVTGTPFFDKVVPAAVDDEPEKTLQLAAGLVEEAIAPLPREHVVGVGLGIASPVDQRSGQLYATGIMPGWVGLLPAEELSVRIGLPVRIINDANAGALAERRFGAATDSDDVLYIRLSNGVGVGVVCDGHVLLGSLGLAGELGHVSVDDRGPLCRCGNRGCLQTIASPDALAGELSRSRGTDVTLTELVMLLDQGDRGALRVVTDAGGAIGRALAMAVMMLNPQVLVVGGELAALGDPLFTAIERAIGQHASASHTRGLEIRAGGLGDSAGARGAAALVLTDLAQQLAARL